MHHHYIYDWQTISLNALSLAWVANYSHWFVPIIPQPEHLVETMVAVMVGVSAMVLNTMKAQQTFFDLRDRRRKRLMEKQQKKKETKE